MGNQTLDAIIAGRAGKALQAVAENVMKMIDEQNAIQRLYYLGKITFEDELRMLKEIEAKYAD